MHYCPKCATELTTKLVAGRERAACPTCDFVHYQNPAPIALLCATRRGELLLARRMLPPLQGYWAPPGGYVEIDESVEEAAVREVKEETNLDVVVEGLVDVYSRADAGIILIVYYGQVVGGTPQAGEDAEEVAFFSRTDVPDQPPPAGGTALDYWIHDVVQMLTEKFREGTWI